MNKLKKQKTNPEELRFFILGIFCGLLLYLLTSFIVGNLQTVGLPKDIYVERSIDANITIAGAENSTSFSMDELVKHPCPEKITKLFESKINTSRGRFYCHLGYVLMIETNQTSIKTVVYENSPFEK